jgi:hypothetical protein
MTEFYFGLIVLAWAIMVALFLIVDGRALKWFS